MAGSSNKSRIKIANEVVSIHKVCELIGVGSIAAVGSSSKLYCPFGAFSHMDGGQSRAFRVYDDTNSAYCFACEKAYGSVSLYAEFHELTREVAATTLLDIVGWKEDTYEQRWERIHKQKDFDSASLIAALDLFCEGYLYDWKFARMEEPYKTPFNNCIQLISKVKTNADAEKWLEATKQYMLKHLPNRT